MKYKNKPKVNQNVQVLTLDWKPLSEDRIRLLCTAYRGTKKKSSEMFNLQLFQSDTVSAKVTSLFTADKITSYEVHTAVGKCISYFSALLEAEQIMTILSKCAFVFLSRPLWSFCERVVNFETLRRGDLTTGWDTSVYEKPAVFKQFDCFLFSVKVSLLASSLEGRGVNKFHYFISKTRVSRTLVTRKNFLSYLLSIFLFLLEVPTLPYVSI